MNEDNENNHHEPSNDNDQNDGSWEAMDWMEDFPITAQSAVTSLTQKSDPVTQSDSPTAQVNGDLIDLVTQGDQDDPAETPVEDEDSDQTRSG